MSVLSGLKVLEIAAIGPVPFAGMMLADMGAEVIRVDRFPAAETLMPVTGFDNRGRKSISVNLKNPAAIEIVLKLVSQADVLLEGFRPGVMERLGLGPDTCQQNNPRLIYGRMTGWGQTGPLAKAAGHDLNYIALSGALHGMGWADRPPTPPLNLVGDYGGGAMMLLTGVLAALYNRQQSGLGQVIDAAMIDGVAALMAPIYSMMSHDMWRDQRGTNTLDGAAHFYGVYECADGGMVSIGSIEPQFYAMLLQTCEIDIASWPPQTDPASWPELRRRLTAVFKTRSRNEWCALMEGTDICFAPVLSMHEAPFHPHNKARENFVDIGGVMQPAPAPRFSRTASQASAKIPAIGEHSTEILRAAGFSAAEIDTLVSNNAVHRPET